MIDPSAGKVPPAPGWWLASDGNWYPPQATPGGPPPAPGLQVPVPGQWYPPPAASTTGRTVAIVLGVVAAGVFGLVALSILAITFLGESASSRFSSVGSQIAPGGGGYGSDDPDGYCDNDRFWSDPDC